MDRTAMKYIIAGSDLLKRYFYNYVTVGIPSQPIHNKLIIAAEFMPAWEKVSLMRVIDKFHFIQSLILPCLSKPNT